MNYRFLGYFNTEKIRNKIDLATEEMWNAWDYRQTNFSTPHGVTKTLPILFEEDMSMIPKKAMFYDYFEKEKEEIEEFFKMHYSEGRLIRMMIVNLPAGKSIIPHTDTAPGLINCHRHHIPVYTNEKVIFKVNDKPKHMQINEVWEIENSLKHSVTNNSEYDRIHIIADWY